MNKYPATFTLAEFMMMMMMSVARTDTSTEKWTGFNAFKMPYIKFVAMVTIDATGRMNNGLFQRVPFRIRLCIPIVAQMSPQKATTTDMIPHTRMMSLF